MKKAVEGLDYTVNEDGSFNIRRGGSYINKGGILYINEPVKTQNKEVKSDEVQK